MKLEGVYGLYSVYLVYSIIYGVGRSLSLGWLHSPEVAACRSIATHIVMVVTIISLHGQVPNI